jgi:hypothetical protein
MFINTKGAIEISPRKIHLTTTSVQKSIDTQWRATDEVAKYLDDWGV